jgi:hypothetical protein
VLGANGGNSPTERYMMPADLLIWPLLAQVFVVGPLGMRTRYKIARQGRSAETIDSPSAVTRWTYRYLIFSYNYTWSFFLTPLLLWPLTQAEVLGGTFTALRQHELGGPFLVIAMVPLAIAFSIWSCWALRQTN